MTEDKIKRSSRPAAVKKPLAKSGRRAAASRKASSAKANALSHESALARASKSSPPASWFEEDTTKLKSRVESFEKDILDFCAANGLSDRLLPMLERIRRGFNLGGPARLNLITDPETDEVYLRIGVSVRGSVNEIADAYDRYISEWTNNVPSHIANLIRLSLTAA